MIFALYLVVLVAALIGFVLAAFLLLELIAARPLAMSGFEFRQSPPRAPIVAIMPAHNEQSIITQTVATTISALQADDRLIVIADNCTDDTAAHARAAGAEVIERHDPDRRGKGYALQYAIDHLRDAPPDTVLFLDADCSMDAFSMTRVVEMSRRDGVPVQAVYLMAPPAEPKPKDVVSAFAWAFINAARMSGLDTIGFVCRLTGAGMAAPYAVISAVGLASGEIVEDLLLSIQLTETGHAPRLADDAFVFSTLPANIDAANRQHARWEQGSLAMAMRRAPGLVARGLLGGRQCLALGLDVAIPPLFLFATILMVITLSALPFVFAGNAGALIAALAAIACLGLAVMIGWRKVGRVCAPGARLSGLLSYGLSKIGVYSGEARQSTKTWTRTDRD